MHDETAKLLLNGPRSSRTTIGTTIICTNASETMASCSFLGVQEMAVCSSESCRLCATSI